MIRGLTSGQPDLQERKGAGDALNHIAKDPISHEDPNDNSTDTEAWQSFLGNEHVLENDAH